MHMFWFDTHLHLHVAPFCTKMCPYDISPDIYVTVGNQSHLEKYLQYKMQTFKNHLTVGPATVYLQLKLIMKTLSALSVFKKGFGKYVWCFKLEFVLVLRGFFCAVSPNESPHKLL